MNGTRPAMREATNGLRRHLSAAVRLTLLVAIGLLSVGCSSVSATSAGIIQIRNATESAVAVHIDEPSGVVLVHGAPPWQPGACSLEFGTDPGKLSIAVGGPTIQGTPSFQTVVPATTETWITVLVQADGTVTFGAGQIPQGPCASEHEVPPPVGY